MSSPYLQMHLVSSLEKVFPDEPPAFWKPDQPVSILSGERFSFQAALLWDGRRRTEASVELESPAGGLSWRTVELSPSEMAAYPEHDTDYLRTAPGLYPDRLHRPEDRTVALLPGLWRTIWIDLDGTGPAGEFPITVRVRDEAGRELAARRLFVRRLCASLPEQRLRYTQWLHADCLADYYRVPVFGEEHWRIVENFVRGAAELGVNMLFTPLVTPPLDTRVGGERTTVQLLDVTVENGEYRFGFERLRRWIEMGRRCGMRYFEMCHLFTQWGAAHCPKVIAQVDGEPRRLFGWEADAAGEEYRRFLQALLPQLVEKLREWDVADRTIFHLSDEPYAQHLEQYRTLRRMVEPLLGGLPIMDALSNYEYYEQGVVDRPICATNHIQQFLEAQVPGLWAYYCCSQSVDVSNRFFSMPSARNRIIGLQLYKYRIEGFLHWGYNFYNTDLSRRPIDPFRVTDGGGAFPSGDAFSVYPGVGGQPEESLRAVVFLEALQDMRALELLESLTDREFVIALMESGLRSPLTFNDYPHQAAYILELRRRVNEEIARRTGEEWMDVSKQAANQYEEVWYERTD